MLPPDVHFITKVKLDCVNARTGKVEPSQFTSLLHWTPESSIQSLLKDLRREMASPQNRKTPQPPEGCNFEF
jgi:ubiquitin-conjugating enzyme E2 variant